MIYAWIYFGIGLILATMAVVKSSATGGIDQEIREKKYNPTAFRIGICIGLCISAVLWPIMLAIAFYRTR